MGRPSLALGLGRLQAEPGTAMELRRLGRTELMVSAVGFGGGPIGGGEEEHDPLAVKLLRRAIELGVNFFDTAPTYGRSELRIGQAIQGYPRESLIIATKVERYDSRSRRDWRERPWSKETAKRLVRRSLERLQTDYIDLVQLHAVGSLDDLDQILDEGGALEGLRELQAQGLVRFIGLTGGHNPLELEVLVEAIKTDEFDTVQPSYNIEFQEAAAPGGVFATAEEHDVGVIIKKPLVEQPRRGRRWRSLIPKYGATRLLSFVLEDPRVSTVIPGMTSIAQVEEDVSVGLQRGAAELG